MEVAPTSVSVPTLFYPDTPFAQLGTGTRTMALVQTVVELQVSATGDSLDAKVIHLKL